MPDIKQSIVPHAPAGSVHLPVSWAEGLARWWAAGLVELDTGAAEPGCNNRNTVYRLRPELKAPNDAAWRRQTGNERSGTAIRFLLESAGQGTQLRFLHGGWQAENRAAGSRRFRHVKTDYFTSCNAAWGGLMYRFEGCRRRCRLPVVYVAAGGLRRSPFCSPTGRMRNDRHR